MGDAETIRVFLLDDHEVVRRGVRELLDAEDDITVVGEAGTAERALARIPATRPDVAMLDVRLPDGDGIDGVPGDPIRARRDRVPDADVVLRRRRHRPGDHRRRVRLPAQADPGQRHRRCGSPRRAGESLLDPAIAERGC